MKFRSLLLVCCMFIVPGMALCTHLIPTEIRRSMRRTFAPAASGQPADAARETAAIASSGDVAAPAPPGDSDRTASETSDAALPTAARVPVTSAAPNAPADRPPVAATATATPPVPPPLVSQMADRTRQVRDQQAREQHAIAARLESLGAVAFECQPIPGSPGLHGSSCRMPIDSIGQLQRVFHATGPDPTSASAALLEQVTAWRRRTTLPPQAESDAKDERREETAAAEPAADNRFR